ncbi:MAG: hypothetical protein ACK5IN_09490 [Microbacterium sp.]|uniref:hypothetical protein n=1 Tax=Microbacterium sp. TaxID=51671 RepID=UPI003A84C9ED
MAWLSTTADLRSARAAARAGQGWQRHRRAFAGDHATRPDRASVAVPTDIETLRATDPGRARDWRREVREQLRSLLERGGRIVGFDREDGYLVDLEEAQ